MSVENLKKFALKLGQTQNFIVSATMDIIEADEFKKSVADHNRSKLRRGMGFDDTPLGSYAPDSIPIRIADNLQVAFIDLKRSGDFYDDIRVQSAKTSASTPAIMIDNTNWKWETDCVGWDADYSLKDRWPDIFGINDKWLPYFGGKIATPLAQRISNFWKI